MRVNYATVEAAQLCWGGGHVLEPGCAFTMIGVCSSGKERPGEEVVVGSALGIWHD